jgi:hypothetical protein
MLFPVAATQSVWGKCYKYFPMKTVFSISILVFEIGSLICGMSSSFARIFLQQDSLILVKLFRITATLSLRDAL